MPILPEHIMGVIVLATVVAITLYKKEKMMGSRSRLSLNPNDIMRRHSIYYYPLILDKSVV